MGSTGLGFWAEAKDFGRQAWNHRSDIASRIAGDPAADAQRGWDWQQFLRDQAAAAGRQVATHYGPSAAEAQLRRQAPALTAGAIGGGTVALLAVAAVLLLPRLLK